jgi:hypothetical protein
MPTGVRTPHCGQIGLPQREQRSRVSVLGCVAQGTGPVLANVSGRPVMPWRWFG